MHIGHKLAKLRKHVSNLPDCLRGLPALEKFNITKAKQKKRAYLLLYDQHQTRDDLSQSSGSRILYILLVPLSRPRKRMNLALKYVEIHPFQRQLIFMTAISCFISKFRLLNIVYLGNAYISSIWN